MVMDHLMDKLGSETHFVHQCKFHGDCDGDGKCKRSLKLGLSEGGAKLVKNSEFGLVIEIVLHFPQEQILMGKLPSAWLPLNMPTGLV